MTKDREDGDGRKPNQEIADTQNPGRSIVFVPREIKLIREAHNMTQVEFAQRMGTTSTSISRWERGTIKGGPSRMAIMLLKTMAREGGLHHLID